MEDQLYIAKDRDGCVFLYPNKIPIIREGREWSNNESGTEIDNCSILDGIPWEKSLHKVTFNLTPILPDPREELKVDDKVWVWAKEGSEKYPRHFCSYEKEGTGIYVFLEGRTSFTEDRNGHHWKYWEKA